MADVKSPCHVLIFYRCCQKALEAPGTARQQVCLAEAQRGSRWASSNDDWQRTLLPTAYSSCVLR